MLCSIRSNTHVVLCRVPFNYNKYCHLALVSRKEEMIASQWRKRISSTSSMTSSETMTKTMMATLTMQSLRGLWSKRRREQPWPYCECRLPLMYKSPAHSFMCVRDFTGTVYSCFSITGIKCHTMKSWGAWDVLYLCRQCNYSLLHSHLHLLSEWTLDE